MYFHFSPFGKDTWRLIPGLSWFGLTHLFSIADFNQYWFVVINHSLKHNSFCEFFESFRKSSSLKVVLRTPNMMILFLKERSWSWTPQFTPEGFPNLWSSQKNRVGFQPSFQCLNSLIGLPPSLDGYIPRVRIQKKQTKRYRNAILCPLLKARFAYEFYVNIYNERFSKKFSYNENMCPKMTSFSHL